MFLFWTLCYASSSRASSQNLLAPNTPRGKWLGRGQLPSPPTLFHTGDLAPRPTSRPTVRRDASLPAGLKRSAVASRVSAGRVRSAPSGFQPYRDPIHPSGETRRAADGLGVEGRDRARPCATDGGQRRARKTGGLKELSYVALGLLNRLCQSEVITSNVCTYGQSAIMFSCQSYELCLCSMVNFRTQHQPEKKERYSEGENGRWGPPWALMTQVVVPKMSTMFHLAHKKRQGCS